MHEVTKLGFHKTLSVRRTENLDFFDYIYWKFWRNSAIFSQKMQNVVWLLFEFLMQNFLFLDYVWLFMA